MSESSLPSIIIFNEEEKKSEIITYSINGKYLADYKEDQVIEFPVKIKDLNTYEYIAYYSKSQVNVRNLPSLSLQIVILYSS